MAAPARATATADPLKNGRSCSRITTRVTSIGGSSTGTRPSSPRTPMAWLAAQSQGEAEAPSCPGSSPAGAADGGWRWPIRDDARAGRSIAAIAPTRCWADPGAWDSAARGLRRRSRGRSSSSWSRWPSRPRWKLSEGEWKAETNGQRIADLELQQARYEASLAERRYAACDPDNRLIAAQLEKSWEASLQRVKACEARLHGLAPTASVQAPDLSGLADDLEGAWTAPGVPMPSGHQLLRALVTGMIADIDEDAREVVLTVHWRGGQHSQLRVRKPKPGEHGCRTPEEALAVMRSMASRWSDEDIAASLNRMGMRTGQGKSWTAHRVSSLRRVHGIQAYRSAEKNGEWLTLSEAAAKLGVSHHRMRALLKAGIVIAEQVMKGAPHQIRASDLDDQRVGAFLDGASRPRRGNGQNQPSMFSDS